MSEQVVANKSKPIAKTSGKTSKGKPVRLWVRAKFLGFRRYISFHYM
jgi:hypothetical protein